MNNKRMLLGIVLIGSIMIAGCTQKAADSQAAIEQSKTKATVEAQADYLVSQANAFVNSKEFDEAIKTAKYILSNLDKESQEAKSIIAKAEEELKKLASQKMEEVKGDLKSKLDGFGN